MKLLIFILFTFFTATSGDVVKTEKKPVNIKTVIGKASYYASFFHGRKTTNGERYSNDKFTAAHLKLPFGTIVTVTNLANGKTVDVRINDRGPHSKILMIDLSQAAAKELGFYSQGVAKVEMSYTLPEAE